MKKPDVSITHTEKLSGVQDGLPLPARYGAIIAIAFGISVSVLDGAIANVALPTIARDLNTTPTYSIWIVNAYQVAMMISLLSFSSIGEIWGYRKVYILGLGLFTCTSLLCALSDSLVTLTVARALQGFGAAAIVSVNTALLRIIYPAKFLSRGIGINALIVSVSAAAGPTIASGILSIASWPWLFAINIPVGLIAFGLAYRFLPQNTAKTPGRKFDITSGIMNALTFGLIILVIEGFTHNFGLYIILSAIIALIISASVFVNRERKKAAPIFPVDLFRIPVFTLSVSTSLISFIAQMLAMVSLPFFIQTNLGKDAVATGLLLTPWPLATMVSAPLAGVLSSKINAGLLGGIGLSIFAVGLFFLGALPEHPTDIQIIWPMAVCGFGFGLFQTPNNSTMISSAPPNRSGGASGMLGTTRLVGQTTGAALVALLFNVFPSNSMHVSLYLACGIAVVAAIVSMLRIGKPTVAELNRSKTTTTVSDP